MKIALDARWIFPEISGIGMYTQELIRHLAALQPEESVLLLFHHAEVRDRVMAFPELKTANFEACLLPWGPFAPASQILLPGWLRRRRVRVYHSPNYMIPFAAFPRRRSGPIRCLVTLHDLIPLLFPDHAPRSRKARLFPLFRRVMAETAARADLLLTVSESSRRDILEQFDIPSGDEGRVRVIPEGVDTRYHPGDPPPADPPELLYVGRFDPYKNVPGLVRAFAEVRRRHPSVRLRLIGPEDPRYPEAREEARRLGLEEALLWQGYASDAELVEAYRRARIKVLPTRYEGFGLTVLEAMASGTPVVCSPVASLPEVAGDAALYADPGQPQELARQICRLLEEDSLYAEVRQRGLERAARFRWADTARATLEAYRQAAALAPPPAAPR